MTCPRRSLHFLLVTFEKNPIKSSGLVHQLKTGTRNIKMSSNSIFRTSTKCRSTSQKLLKNWRAMSDDGLHDDDADCTLRKGSLLAARSACRKEAPAVNQHRTISPLILVRGCLMSSFSSSSLLSSPVVEQPSLQPFLIMTTTTRMRSQ